MLLVASAGVLLAHDLFLKLGSYYVRPGEAARVAVLNGTFSTSENAVAPGRLRDLSVVSPAGRRAIPRSAWRPSGDTSWLTVPTAEAGTYVIGASLTPSEIALTAAQFNEYLEHDGIPDVLEARREGGELNRDVRERYHKHVKTIIQVGGARTDSYRAALGYPAELVPLANPYDVRVGDTLAVRALVDGRPVGNQLVIAGGEPLSETGSHTIPETRARSDAEGVARFVITTPGKWYVKFIHMAPLRGDSVDYESKWATITFEVR